MDPLSPWVCLLCSRMRSSIAILSAFSLSFKAIDDDDAWWDFGGNGYGDAEASIIAKALENDETSATQLNLMGMSLGQSHGQKSCTINSRHRPIYVYANVVFPALDNGIGEAGLQAIAKMMESNSTIVRVDLRCACISAGIACTWAPWGLRGTTQHSTVHTFVSRCVDVGLIPHYTYFVYPQTTISTQRSL